MNTDTKRLHWTRKLALIQHNFHSSSLTQDFSFFKTIQAQYIAEGVDLIANIKDAYVGDADELFMIIDNLNSGIAWVFQDAFENVYNCIKTSNQATSQYAAENRGGEKSKHLQFVAAIVHHRKIADTAIDKLLASAITLIQQQPTGAQDSAARLLVFGSSFAADGVQVCLTHLTALEHMSYEQAVQQIAPRWELVQHSIKASVAGFKLFVYMIESHDDPAGEAAAQAEHEVTLNERRKSTLSISSSSDSSLSPTTWNPIRRLSYAFASGPPNAGSHSRKGSTISLPAAFRGDQRRSSSNASSATSGAPAIFLSPNATKDLFRRPGSTTDLNSQLTPIPATPSEDGNPFENDFQKPQSKGKDAAVPDSHAHFGSVDNMWGVNTDDVSVRRMISRLRADSTSPHGSPSGSPRGSPRGSPGSPLASHHGNNNTSKSQAAKRSQHQPPLQQGVSASGSKNSKQRPSQPNFQEVVCTRAMPVPQKPAMKRLDSEISLYDRPELQDSTQQPPSITVQPHANSPALTPAAPAPTPESQYPGFSIDAYPPMADEADSSSTTAWQPEIQQFSYPRRRRSTNITSDMIRPTLQDLQVVDPTSLPESPTATDTDCPSASSLGTFDELLPSPCTPQTPQSVFSDSNNPHKTKHGLKNKPRTRTRSRCRCPARTDPNYHLCSSCWSSDTESEGDEEEDPWHADEVDEHDPLSPLAATAIYLAYTHSFDDSPNAQNYRNLYADLTSDTADPDREPEPSPENPPTPEEQVPRTSPVLGVDETHCISPTFVNRALLAKTVLTTSPPPQSTSPSQTRRWWSRGSIFAGAANKDSVSGVESPARAGASATAMIAG